MFVGSASVKQKCSFDDCGASSLAILPRNMGQQAAAGQKKKAFKSKTYSLI